MEKIKNFCRKHEEVIRYLAFGVITTILSFAMFYGALWAAKTFFGALENGKDSTRYLIANTVASVLKWLTGMLVAFYTNRRWVFRHADRDVSVIKQLLVFAEGRVFTLIAAAVSQYLLELLFALVIRRGISVFGMSFSADMLGTTAALLICSVGEVVANYFLSKKFVFKAKGESGKGAHNESGRGES